MRAADLHQLARTLREVALLATENTGDDRVNAGELAVLEDVAHHPGATIGDITRRTGLAQSLVSRITRAMGGSGALTIEDDPSDRRKVRVTLASRTRSQILRRAALAVGPALAVYAPTLSAQELDALERHLGESARLLAVNTERLRQIHGGPGHS